MVPPRTPAGRVPERELRQASTARLNKLPNMILPSQFGVEEDERIVRQDRILPHDSELTEKRYDGPPRPSIGRQWRRPRRAIVQNLRFQPVAVRTVRLRRCQAWASRPAAAVPNRARLEGSGMTARKIS